MQAATVFAYLLISSVLASTEPEEEISEPAREEPQKKPMPANPGSNPSIGSNIGSNQGPSSSESGYFTQNSGSGPSSASTSAADSRCEPHIPDESTSEEPTSNGDLSTSEDVQGGSAQATARSHSSENPESTVIEQTANEDMAELEEFLQDVVAGMDVDDNFVDQVYRESNSADFENFTGIEPVSNSSIEPNSGSNQGPSTSTIAYFTQNSGFDDFMNAIPPYHRAGSTVRPTVQRSAQPTLEGVPDLDLLARCDGFNHSSGSFSAPWSTKDSDSLPSAEASGSPDRSAEMGTSAQHNRTTAEESGLHANPAQPENQCSSFNPLPPEPQPLITTAVEDPYRRVHNTDTGYPSTSRTPNPNFNPDQAREADQPTTSRGLTWIPNENTNFPNNASTSGGRDQHLYYEQSWQEPDPDQPSTSSAYRGSGNHPTHFCQPRFNPEEFPDFDGHEFDHNLQDADVEEEPNDNYRLHLVRNRLNRLNIPTNEEVDVSGILQAQAAQQLPDANNGPNAPNADNNNGRRWMLVEFLFRSALNPQHQNWIQWTGDGRNGNELQFTLNHLQAARQWNLYRGKGESKEPARDFAHQMRNFYRKTLELTRTTAHTYRFLSFFDHDFVRLLAMIAALRQNYTNPMQLKKTNGSKKKRDDRKK